MFANPEIGPICSRYWKLSGKKPELGIPGFSEQIDLIYFARKQRANTGRANMPSHLKRKVPKITQKWLIIQEFADASGLECTYEGLAKELDGIPGANKTTIGEVMSDRVPGSKELHTAILKYYGLDWPVKEYFDESTSALEQDVDAFRNRLFRQHREPITTWLPLERSNQDMCFDERFFSMQLGYCDSTQALSIEFDGRSVECVDIKSRFGASPVCFFKPKSLYCLVVTESDNGSLFPAGKPIIANPAMDSQSDVLTVFPRRRDVGHAWEIDVADDWSGKNIISGATPFMVYTKPRPEDRLRVTVRSRFPAFEFNAGLLVGDSQQCQETKNEIGRIFEAHLQNKIARAPQDPLKRAQSDDFEVFVQTYEPREQND